MKNEGLRPYLEEARQLMRSLGHTIVKYIPREGNKIADKLAKKGASGIGVDVRSRDASPEESPGIAGQDGP